MLFISLIFLIICGSLSLSHCAKFIRYCIFYNVYLSIFANSLDISSILLFSSFIYAYLFLSFYYCYFFVWLIISLFFPKLMRSYVVIRLAGRWCCWAHPVNLGTLSASVYTDASWPSCIWCVVHDSHFLLLFCLQIPLQIHHPLSYFIFGCSVAVCYLLLIHHLLL